MLRFIKNILGWHARVQAEENVVLNTHMNEAQEEEAAPLPERLQNRINFVDFDSSSSEDSFSSGSERTDGSGSSVHFRGRVDAFANDNFSEYSESTDSEGTRSISEYSFGSDDEAMGLVVDFAEGFALRVHRVNAVDDPFSDVLDLTGDDAVGE